MMWLRNPVLFLVCVVLLANLLFNAPPRQQGMPHGRRAGFEARDGRSSAAASVADVRRESDPEFGQLLYASNCTACHGPRGHGMPRQGVNLRESTFVASLSDAQLVAFLRQGRTPADPTSIMGMLMPPRGGNRALDDPALAEIVAFLREVQAEAREEAAASAASAAADGGAATALGNDSPTE